MGTSVNQRSTSRGPWAAHHATIGSNGIPIVRQAAEIWRAAFGDRNEQLASELCSNEILEGAKVVSSTNNGRLASLRYESALEESDSGSLVVEFAKRSVVRAASEQGGPAHYGADLFAEAANYFVSRDLPSFVGAQGRVASTLASIELKDAVRNSARSTALKVAKTFSEEALLTKKGWKLFVTKTAKILGGDGNGA